MKPAESPTTWNEQQYYAGRGHHSKRAAFMFTAGQDCPVITAAQTLSRGSSAAAWAICARLANGCRELVVKSGASSNRSVLAIYKYSLTRLVYFGLYGYIY